MSDIIEVLQRLGTAYKIHEHAPVFTCEEADREYQDLKAGRSKNLFVRNRNGKKHYLIIATSDMQIDLKKLGVSLGEAGLSFASAERLLKYLGVTPGAVSPFGLINDSQHEVEVVLDEALWRNERLLFHPNRNTATVELSREDFQKFLKATGNPVRSIRL